MISPHEKEMAVYQVVTHSSVLGLRFTFIPDINSLTFHAAIANGSGITWACCRKASQTKGGARG